MKTGIKKRSLDHLLSNTPREQDTEHSLKTAPRKQEADWQVLTSPMIAPGFHEEVASLNGYHLKISEYRGLICGLVKSPINGVYIPVFFDEKDRLNAIVRLEMMAKIDDFRNVLGLKRAK